jgi:hypothetical protein
MTDREAPGMWKGWMQPPKGSMALMTVGACALLCSRYVAPFFAPEYVRPLEGLASLIFGVTIIYLVVAIPRGYVVEANRGMPRSWPSYLQIPPVGPWARPLLGFLGLCLCGFGIAELAGYT